jgi:hypothetical protein
VTELLGVDELPHRAVVDLEAALCQLGYQPAQREVPVSAALQQPVTPGSGYLLRLVATHLAGLDAARRTKELHPVDHRTVTDAKARRRLPARKTFVLDCSHHALAKICRIRLAHPYWPPVSSQQVESNST